MERDTESDPQPEWTAPGPETGLEEPVWGLELGGESESYPERPEEADCIYYLRTGFCGYGSRCRFNHPRDRAAVMGAGRGGVGEYPERAGQPVCQYYMRTGTCKFGSSCKYHHPKQGGGSVSPVPLNYYGYPLRPSEKECSYYVKTGQCKFGVTCKFHHPAPHAVQVPVPSPVHPVAPVPTPVPAPTLYPTVQSPSGLSSQQYGVVMARPPLMPGSYVQGPYGPSFLLSPSMVSVPSWNPYTASVSPGTQTTVGSSSIFGVTPLSPSAAVYSGSHQPVPSSVGPSSSIQKEQSFPERPGQPECQYYMKTGDCKYGSSCRYHHPPEVIAPKADVILSPLGLPLRPGAPPCTHYSQHGVCKFRAACKFDHPMGTLSYSPSASSLADMPVAPHPVGSTIGTLAPSSSSSELRPELLSGSSKDLVPAIMSSSVSRSSESVGSVFSKGAPVPHSSTQQFSQSSASSTGSGSSNTEVHASS
ncbi:zinc finger CCCH domain-containing protein 34-like [Durio zibethinus]|uniref:Zinc finger CCCH domain-containing protein 34-like n=1 Tax=Durio zibethinus TaxID=66656 RepID=A0A6P6A6F1_DURZI|nr:zinc finger CCCH domain-containing protein 34-like [Durio zibethinus]